MNYYPHHIGDYSRKTAHLTALEDGTYRRMLDLYYSSEKPLPGNRQGLYRLLRARSKDEREAVDTVLTEFFEERNGSWHNDRCDEEIAKWQAKAGKAKQSAAVRWHSERNANAYANASETHDPPQSVGNANQNQEPKPKEKTSAFALPEWVPKDAWQGWLEVRKRNKAPNTDRALNLALTELQALRDSGNDPKAVLERATMRGWRGLFPLQTQQAQTVDPFAGAL